MSDLLSIVIAEPSYRIRLTQSWPLRIDTADTLTFYSLHCICRSHRHEEHRRQVRPSARHARPSHHEGRCARTHSRLRHRAKNSADLPGRPPGPAGIPDPALHRLEYKKLLSSRWKPSETGREAKFYELTSRGRTHLKVETENWTRLTDVVSLILKGTLEGI